MLTEKEVIQKLQVSRQTLVRYRHGRIVRYKKLKDGCYYIGGVTIYVSILRFRTHYVYKKNRVYYTDKGVKVIENKLKERRKWQSL